MGSPPSWPSPVASPATGASATSVSPPSCARELPHTWAAWSAGHITEWTATVIARETACLPLEHRLTVDHVIASDAERLSLLGQRELIGLLRTEAERLDPAAVVARRRRAESERCVTLRPAPDTMTWLTALLPVKDGVAVLAALTRVSDSARSAGDSRSKGQVMADSLVASVLGQPSTTPTTTAAVPVRLGLVMSDSALLGTSDEPAHLDDYGPIPAELAREIVAGALTDDEQVWVRRLYTSPTTGELVTMDSHQRLFPATLSRFVRLRDRACRTPWCDAPIRHTDHPEDHAPRRSHQRSQRPGPLRGLQLRQAGPRMAGSTRTGRHREPRHRDHPPDRSRLPVPSTRHRHGAASDGTGPAHRLRPRRLTCAHLAWWEVD